ncbi:MAG: hypothetical protein KKB31_01395 [Nanoarchaeota archaeon]|nr:hypothetical protein [Nanoarchaeota archaeon]
MKEKNYFKIATFLLLGFVLVLFTIYIYQENFKEDKFIQFGEVSIKSKYINSLAQKLDGGNYIICDIEENKCSGFKITHND